MYVAPRGNSLPRVLRISPNPARRRPSARLRRAIVAGLTAVACVPAATAGAQTFTEGWESFPLADWTIENNSSTIGPSTWMGGADTDAFVAYSGTPDSYVGVNYLSAGGVGSTVSTWLISPPLTDLTQGDTVSFYTRTPARSTNPDRLELRVSTNGSCDPGTAATDVGDFSTLVTSVNPTLERGGYPETWTKISATLPAMAASTGCLAFRYHVTGAGFGGANGNFVGIDQLEVTDQPDDVVPETSFVTTPPTATADNEIWFTYTATPLAGVARIECRLIGPGYPDPAFETCGASAHGWTTLPEGTWTYEIRAVSHGGNVDPTPAAYTFTYDATAPETAITAGPTGRVAPAGATFAYASVPVGDATDFECRLRSAGDDGPAFASCDATGLSVPGLTDGEYVFEVRAIDAAGNVDATPAARAFTVDASLTPVDPTDPTDPTDPVDPTDPPVDQPPAERPPTEQPPAGLPPVNRPPSGRPAGRPPTAVAPRLSSVRLTRTTFRAWRSGSPFGQPQRMRTTGGRGSWLRLKVDRSVRLELRVSRAKGRSWTRLKGTEKGTANPKTTRIPVRGRFGGKTLRTGRYRLTIVAIDRATGARTTKHVTFRIRR